MPFVVRDPGADVGRRPIECRNGQEQSDRNPAREDGEHQGQQQLLHIPLPRNDQGREGERRAHYEEVADAPAYAGATAAARTEWPFTVHDNGFAGDGAPAERFLDAEPRNIAEVSESRPRVPLVHGLAVLQCAAHPELVPAGIETGRSVSEFDRGSAVVGAHVRQAGAQHHVHGLPALGQDPAARVIPDRKPELLPRGPSHGQIRYPRWRRS
jgi:hypothetical protein